jgi:hypothetical protein
MFRKSKTFEKLFIMLGRSDGSRLKFTLVEASCSDFVENIFRKRFVGSRDHYRHFCDLLSR